MDKGTQASLGNQDFQFKFKTVGRSRIKLGHQIMVGLPESTKLDELRCCKDIIKLRPKIKP